MNTTLTKYGATLLPLGVLVLGVFTAANDAGANLFNWQTILQLVILLATTGSSFWLKLVPGPWAGALKTGAGIVGAVASALVAVVPDGHFTQTTVLLFLTTAFHAVATQVGVKIRTNEAIDARETPDGVVPSITSLPTVTASDLVPFAGDDEDPDTYIAKHSAAPFSSTPPSA